MPIFVLTIAWTALVAQTVVASGDYRGVAQTIVAIVSTSTPGEFLIIIYSLMTVTVLDFGGGYIVVTARYLTNMWVKSLQDKFRHGEANRGALSIVNTGLPANAGAPKHRRRASHSMSRFPVRITESIMHNADV